MWAAAAFAVFLIFWSPAAGAVRAAIRSAFPGSFQLIVGGAVGFAAMLLLALAVARVRTHRAARFTLIALGLAVSAAYIAYFRTGNPNVDVVEATHFVEYGVLTWLFYRVWRTRGDVSTLLLPLVAGLIVGTLDEWVQWYVPDRIGEMGDIALDLVALVAGLLVSAGAAPPPEWRSALKHGSARRLSVAFTVGLAVFAGFFESVHVAYVIHDDEIGSFLSRFDRGELAQASASRAVAWAAGEPAAPGRFSREDQYRAEAMWHVQRRNDDVPAGRFDAAWAENRILEKYFAPALDLRGPRTGVGYRWPAEQHADVQRRAGPPTGHYVSNANPWPLFTSPIAMVLSAASPSTLDICFVDVEGGQATLIVTPGRESILTDAGWAGRRDADRILAAAREAKLSRIDFLVVTHFHSDHVGGVPDLARRMPIKTFVNNGAAKGGSGRTLAAIQQATDVWQLHRSTAAGASNTRDEPIANVDEGTTAFAIGIEARADGRFRVVNRRTGFSKEYAR